MAILFWFFQAILLPDYPAISYPSLALIFVAEVGLGLWLLVRGVNGNSFNGRWGDVSLSNEVAVVCVATSRHCPRGPRRLTLGTCPSNCQSISILLTRNDERKIA